MLSTIAPITTGHQLRQLLLAQLRLRGLLGAAAWQQGRPLSAYLSAMWHLSRQYHERPFQFQFLAELLVGAFDYPALPSEQEPDSTLPYQPQPLHMAPYGTPAYYAEFTSYAYFERVIRQQLEELKRIAQLPALPAYDAPIDLDGHLVRWANLHTSSFLERGTESLEDEVEPDDNSNWGNLVGILRDGQYAE